MTTEKKTRPRPGGRLGAGTASPKTSTERTGTSYDWMRGVEALRVGDMRLKMLLHVIARACTPDGSCTHLSQSDLAQGVEVADTSAVRRIIERGEKKGLLRREMRNSPGGRLNTRYVLLIEPVPPEGVHDGPVAEAERASRKPGGESPEGVHEARSRQRASDRSPEGLSDFARGPLRKPSDHLEDHHLDHQPPAHARKATAEGKETEEAPSRSTASAEAVARGSSEHNGSHPPEGVQGSPVGSDAWVLMVAGQDSLAGEHIGDMRTMGLDDAEMARRLREAAAVSAPGAFAHARIEEQIRKPKARG